MDKLSVLLISLICCVMCVCSGVVYTEWIAGAEPKPQENIQKQKKEEQEPAVIAMNDDAQVINGGSAAMWIRAKVGGVKTGIVSKAKAKSGNWNLRRDGYYYYNMPVKPGEQSEPLIPEIKDKCCGKEERIRIRAEAIQINWIGESTCNGEEAFRIFEPEKPLQHNKSRFI